jgi:adsorption protein B
MAATWLWAFDRALAEVTLFAAVMILIGAVDDLLVDVAWLRHRRSAGLLTNLPPAPPLRLAVFVPAWDEHRVIGAMLRAALSRYRHPDFRILVGCYPNDRATIDAVADVAQRDPRVRLVIGARGGPTTKAECLNTLWRALLRADAADGARTDAVVLHDAEDVVHPAELSVFDHYLGEAALVQLPVVPLIDPAARMVSGHYADEFAESHARQMIVRTGLGAALPLAGVGCAIRRDALDRLAAAADGDPFEAASLTEDYEIGLRIAGLGLPGRFVRLREYTGGPLVATRAYFPDTVRAAVAQKARWVTGIALAGWDRTGWGEHWRAAEWWMRMRDRRAPLAMLALLAAYLALVGWGVSLLAHGVSGIAPPPPDRGLALLLAINAVMLCWRLGVRAAATGAEHGGCEALLSLPRAIVSNYIAMLAARRAMARYVTALLRGRALRWEKTAHRFPAELSTESGDA